MDGHTAITSETFSLADLSFLQLKHSRIHGRGLFSTEDITEGTILFELTGEKATHEYGAYMATQNPNWIGTGYEEWLKMPPGNVGLYINHSCNANVIVNESLQVITLEHIKAHDEILLDYSTTELDPFWKMECSCGHHTCRKMLRAYQFLPYDLKIKYQPYLASVFCVVGDFMLIERS